MGRISVSVALWLGSLAGLSACTGGPTSDFPVAGGADDRGMDAGAGGESGGDGDRDPSAGMDAGTPSPPTSDEPDGGDDDGGPQG